MFHYYYVVVNTFPEGEKLMAKLHSMVKHFYSAISNRKNYNNMLDKHRYLPRNQSQQDHNGSRIVAAHELLKSALRINRGTQAHCEGYKKPLFLTETELRTVEGFEAILREASRLTTVFQNEDW